MTSALALATTPEACDEQLGRLMLQLEELEGRFGELDEFSVQLAEKREEVLDAVNAKLTTDGTRWFVEDLGSSNGTYVGGNVGGLPTTALTPGQKQEISDDDRIYVGAWTRIVVRRATDGEA